MSVAALLLATRQTLRQALALEDTQCNVQPNGQPDNVAGDLYISIHEGDTSVLTDDSYHLTENISLRVTVTLRTGEYTGEGFGDLMIANERGLDAWCRQVVAALHLNWPNINAANDEIGEDANGFALPLAYEGAGSMQTQSGEWAGGTPDDSDYFMTRELRFGGARRVQNVAHQT